MSDEFIYSNWIHTINYSYMRDSVFWLQAIFDLFKTNINLLWDINKLIYLCEKSYENIVTNEYNTKKYRNSSQTVNSYRFVFRIPFYLKSSLSAESFS